MSQIFNGLAHISVYVRDYEESVRFYVDVLEFHVIYEGFRNKGTDSEMRLILLRQKDCLVELLAQTNIQPERRAQMGVRGAVDHFGLVTPDLDAALERFKCMGIQTEGPVSMGDDLFDGFRCAFIYGPSGERIELFSFTNGGYEKYYQEENAYDGKGTPRTDL